MLQTLRLQSKRIAPINRLPEELLVAIFEHLAPVNCAPLARGDLSGMFSGHLIRLVVMQVCRLWHDIAVGCPALWSYINLDQPKGSVDTFLRRSLQEPLTVLISMQAKGMETKLKFLKEYGARLRTLYVGPGHMVPPPPSDMTRDVRLSMPRLEHLSIFLPGDSSQGGFIEWMVHNVPKAELKALAANVLPQRLATLSTDSFPQLTHLFLSFRYVESNGLVAEPLLRLFKAAPLLQHINMTLPNAHWPPEQNLPSVTLNHVRSLLIHEGPLDDVFHLLGFLTLPPAVLLCINESWTDFEIPQLPRIPPLSLFQSLTFMEVSLHQHYLDWTATNADMTSGFLINATTNAASFWSGLLEMSRAAIPYSQIEVLHLRLSDDLAIRILPEFLPNFIHLKELMFLSTHDYRFDHTATKLLETVVPILNQSNPIVCPELRVLGFRMDVAYEKFPFDHLARMADARYNAGHPLSRVVYQPLLKKHDAWSRQRFSNSISALKVESAEYRQLEEESLCPFKLRDCWKALPGAETYWVVPSLRRPNVGRRHPEIFKDQPRSYVVFGGRPILMM